MKCRYFLSGSYFVPYRRVCSIVVLLFAVCLSSARGQQAAPSEAKPIAGGNWANVKALPTGTKVHVTMDHGGKACRVFAVTEDALTCSSGKASSAVLQRTEIQHIKLAHYGRSTLVGAGIGGGVGALIGAIGGRNQCSAKSFCLNFISAGQLAAILAVPGVVLGGGVGFGTDFARGGAIYTRP
jgi:hypothetical protein